MTGRAAPTVPGPIVLETARLVLREPRRDDAGGLLALASAWEVAKETRRIPHPFTEADAAAWIGAGQVDANGEVRFVIELRERATVVGSIGTLAGIGEWIVGYWIGMPYWGRGYATEALHALIDFAFGRLAAERLAAETFAENRASQRVLEKAGFHRAEEREVNWPHRGGRRQLRRCVLERPAVGP